MDSTQEKAAAAFPARISGPAWQFNPPDGYLIVNYLLKKVNNEAIAEEIVDVNLKLEDPEALIKAHPRLGEKEWYFFTPRDRKYPNGGRPDRGCKTGYWKATGKDTKILFEEKLVGFCKKLVFYRGEAQKGDKTNLIMKEYRLNEPPRVKTSDDDMKLDDWVLCKIYEKASKARSRSSSEGSSSRKRKRDNTLQNVVAGEHPLVIHQNSDDRYLEPVTNDLRRHTYGDPLGLLDQDPHLGGSLLNQNRHLPSYIPANGYGGLLDQDPHLPFCSIPGYGYCGQLDQDRHLPSSIAGYRGLLDPHLPSYIPGYRSLLDQGHHVPSSIPGYGISHLVQPQQDPVSLIGRQDSVSLSGHLQDSVSLSGHLQDSVSLSGHQGCYEQQQHHQDSLNPVVGNRNLRHNPSTINNNSSSPDDQSDITFNPCTPPDLPLIIP